MRWIALALALVACNVTRIDYPEPQNEHEAIVFPICEDHGVVCLPDEQTNWGRIRNSNYHIPAGVELRVGVIYYEPATCEADPEFCRFVILHEIGHLRAGRDQTAADCWAARYASHEQVAAFIDFLRDRGRTERAAALQACKEAL